METTPQKTSWWTRFRHPTIRQSLLRNLIFLILFTSCAIFLVNAFSASQAILQLSQNLIRKATQQTEHELKHFFGNVKQDLQMVQQWGDSGLLELSEPQKLNALFIPILEQNPYISSVILASSEGQEWILMRRKEYWLTRETQISRWGKRKYWTQWSLTNQYEKDWWEELDYDPRTRPWFQGVVKSEDREIHWTEPYTFYTVKEPGITASIRWQPKEKKNVFFVAGLDVLLSDISSFTTSLQVSEQGFAFVFSENSHLLGLPKHPKYQTREAMKPDILKPVHQVSIPILAEAVDQWKPRRSKTTEPLSFFAEEKRWWSGFRPFSLENQVFWIGILIPQDDLMEGMHRQRNIVIGVTIVSLVIAIVLATWLSQRYSFPLEKLVHQSQRIQTLQLTDSDPIHSSLKEIKQLVTAQEQMLFALQSFSRYVPIDVVRELLKQGEVAKIGGKSEVLTILFTDIRGFTSIAEKRSPEEVTQQMANYFEVMLEVLQAHQATIDKFVGDAIVAFWGAPNPDLYHSQHAIHAVLHCQKRLKELNEDWEKRGLPALYTCFGLDTGPVVVGNVGAPSRLNYTVLGDTVNIACRLEGLNRFYGTEILTSERVRTKAGEEFLWRYVDLVAVKGKKVPIKIYEPLGFRQQENNETLLFIKRYEEALYCYQSKNFQGAIETLNALSPSFFSQLSVTRLKSLCLDYLQNPPPEDWDGVTRFQEK